MGPKAGGKGKGKADDDDKMGTCNHVKARHILCEKNGKIMECYKKLQEGWINDGNKVPPPEFGKLAMEYSECSSGKKGGDLGWFPRGKMENPASVPSVHRKVACTTARTVFG
eukprot:tig00000133_g7661.t1